YDFFYENLTSPNKEVARHKISILDDKKVVLFFGGIRKNKGLEYLVEAFQEVKGKIKEAILLVVGRGGRDEESFTYYSSLTCRLYHNEGVIFVERYVPVEEVGYYFAASDVVALPYVEVSQSGVLLLAYSSSKPVVVTDTGGLSEIVEVGRSGLVVPAKDVKA